MSRECGSDVEMMWLVSHQLPDKHTYMRSMSPTVLFFHYGNFQILEHLN